MTAARLADPSALERRLPNIAVLRRHYPTAAALRAAKGHLRLGPVGAFTMAMMAIGTLGALAS